MKSLLLKICMLSLITGISTSGCSSTDKTTEDSSETERLTAVTDSFAVYFCDPAKEKIRMFLKGNDGNFLHNIGKLKKEMGPDSSGLLMAMNGGMYKEDYSPLGMYVENGVQIADLNLRRSDRGNFYLRPNGVFSIAKNGSASIWISDSAMNVSSLAYATQSGPMLLIDSLIHPGFRKGSTHINIRNGVGIRTDGKIVFIISKVPVSMYDIADKFRSLSCKQAMYLDGFISKMYAPALNIYQCDGQFAVIIAVLK